jgi:atrophin-1 interacting protein 5 (WW domain-containing E3 ubiquitin protein ligase 1)
MIDWRFTRGVKEQSDRFLEGFSEVIPIEWLQVIIKKPVNILVILF